MAEIKLTFDITFNRRFVTAFGAAAVMLCAVPELDSESVTLSTYYPAPSGVYTNMITTGNTFLSRDAGAVGIGNSAPGYKLDVTGNLRATTSMTAGTTMSAGGTITAGGAFYAGNSDMYFTQTVHNHTGIGNTAGYAAIENASNYNTLMILGRSNGIGGGRSVSIWDRLDVNGLLQVNGQVQATDSIESQGSAGSGAKGAFLARQGLYGCSAPTSYTYSTPSGGAVTLCGGQYITTTAGVYTKYYTIPLDRGPQLPIPQSPVVGYICCDCPPSGCNGM